jgi:hypothetical protein
MRYVLVSAIIFLLRMPKANSELPCELVDSGRIALRDRIEAVLDRYSARLLSFLSALHPGK